MAVQGRFPKRRRQFGAEVPPPMSAVHGDDLVLDRHPTSCPALPEDLADAQECPWHGTDCCAGEVGGQPLKADVTRPDPLLITYPATMVPAALANPVSFGSAAALCRS